MYKGELRGFPTEIVNWMLEQQDKQGNPKKVHVFEKDIFATQSEGGFNWYVVDQGKTGSFCHSVLKIRDFDLFFKEFPKKPVYPRVMYVSQDKNSLNYPSIRVKRVVFMEKNNRFIAWHMAETLEDSACETTTHTWNYAKDIDEEPQIVELTMEDISAGKGVGIKPELLRIKK